MPAPMIRALAPLVLAAASMLLPWDARPVRAASCRFVLGFATLHALLPGVVGDCLEDERHDPATGDGFQRTGRGLLFWRKRDNVAAFTDGSSTWIVAPRRALGETPIEHRLNTVRFPWEPNPDGLPVVADSYVAASPPAPGPRLIGVRTTLGFASGPLLFIVAGSGFAHGERVTVRGAYTPIYTLVANAPSAPAREVRCASVPLGPVAVRADGSGGFTATLQAPANAHTGGEATIRATGDGGGTGATTTFVDPQGLRISTLRTVSGGCTVQA